MEHNISALPYRRGVGMMILNSENKIWVGKRRNTSIESWQMPQGGIDENEDPHDAMMRELKEETGADSVQLIASSERWLSYDLPREIASNIWGGKFRGQKQMWFLLKFCGNDNEFQIDYQNSDLVEFIDWKWVDVSALTDIVIGFKKDLYRDIIGIFKKYIIDPRQNK